MKLRAPDRGARGVLSQVRPKEYQLDLTLELELSPTRMNEETASMFRGHQSRIPLRRGVLDDIADVFQGRKNTDVVKRDRISSISPCRGRCSQPRGSRKSERIKKGLVGCHLRRD